MRLNDIRIKITTHLYSPSSELILEILNDFLQLKPLSELLSDNDKAKAVTARTAVYRQFISWIQSTRLTDNRTVVLTFTSEQKINFDRIGIAVVDDFEMLSVDVTPVQPGLLDTAWGYVYAVSDLLYPVTPPMVTPTTLLVQDDISNEGDEPASDSSTETADSSEVEPWDSFINDSLENPPIDAAPEVISRPLSSDLQRPRVIPAALMDRFFAELEKINDLHRTHLHPEHCVVLLQMYLDLYDKGEAFNIAMNANPSDAVRMALAATFKTDIQAIIQNGEAILQQEPGLLGKLHPIVKGILAVLATIITGIVVLPIAMEVAKRTGFTRHGYVDTFFKARPEAELTERAFNQTQVKQQLFGHTPSEEGEALTTGILEEIKEHVKPTGPNQ